ncbi:hypothetical protein Lalb_Chr22g0354881 [Lupinus albus]|uniref:Uncharacterized protein n=1 Tax=Lupinus albus TaxID=3870 RepID=A0A6A4NC96_LUPAL|nr:hypothetical protein Lalb_Chr22g0354881 [Lupinus albus]
MIHYDRTYFTSLDISTFLDGRDCWLHAMIDAVRNPVKHQKVCIWDHHHEER